MMNHINEKNTGRPVTGGGREIKGKEMRQDVENSRQAEDQRNGKHHVSPF